jgi:hypothetical protein
MSFHSEEVWESFDALWRRVRDLTRQVKDLEARLALLETSHTGEIERGYSKALGASEEIKLSSSLYEGEYKR